MTLTRICHRVYVTPQDLSQGICDTYQDLSRGICDTYQDLSQGICDTLGYVTGYM